jgi:hypothetical protein
MLLHSGLPLQHAVGAALDQTVSLWMPQQPVVLAVAVADQALVRQARLALLVRVRRGVRGFTHHLCPVRVVAARAVQVVAVTHPMVTADRVDLHLRFSASSCLAVVAVDRTTTASPVPVAMTGRRQLVVGAAADWAAFSFSLPLEQ